MHVTDLSPNLYLYLPSLYHYLVKHLKENASPEAHESDMNRNFFNPHTLADRQKSVSDYHSPDHDHQSANEGAINITSNIRNLITGSFFNFPFYTVMEVKYSALLFQNQMLCNKILWMIMTPNLILILPGTDLKREAYGRLNLLFFLCIGSML